MRIFNQYLRQHSQRRCILTFGTVEPTGLEEEVVVVVVLVVLVDDLVELEEVFVELELELELVLVVLELLLVVPPVGAPPAGVVGTVLGC